MRSVLFALNFAFCASAAAVSHSLRCQPKKKAKRMANVGNCSCRCQPSRRGAAHGRTVGRRQSGQLCRHFAVEISGEKRVRVFARKRASNREKKPLECKPRANSRARREEFASNLSPAAHQANRQSRTFAFLCSVSVSRVDESARRSAGRTSVSTNR